MMILYARTCCSSFPNIRHIFILALQDNRHSFIIHSYPTSDSDRAHWSEGGVTVLPLHQRRSLYVTRLSHREGSGKELHDIVSLSQAQRSTCAVAKNDNITTPSWASFRLSVAANPYLLRMCHSKLDPFHPSQVASWNSGCTSGK